MKTIKLSNSDLTTTVDDEDFELVSQFKWRLYKRKQYAVAYVPVKLRHKYKTTSIQMQRLIMFDKLNSGELVDHIDRNKLNNTRNNLRIVNMSQSNMNRGKIVFNRKSKNQSKYKGVFWSRNKWRAAITVDSKKIYLGFFTDEKEAAIAYNKAAMKFHGEYAYLNTI